MEKSHVSRIPVLDDHRRLIGIIAQADVATRTNHPEKTAEVVRGDIKIERACSLAQHETHSDHGSVIRNEPEFWFKHGSSADQGWRSSCDSKSEDDYAHARQLQRLFGRPADPRKVQL